MVISERQEQIYSFILYMLRSRTLECKGKEGNQRHLINVVDLYFYFLFNSKILSIKRNVSLKRNLIF